MTIGLALTACACTTVKPDLPSGAAAYSRFPAPAVDSSPRNYVIGPLDVVAVTVFQEPDLSATNLLVDPTGFVVLPLIGNVKVAGQTAAELQRDIAARYASRYLVDPQVTVAVTTAASQRFTVEGSVQEPGLYDIRGRTTLLDAMAVAKGPTNVARLHDVVIFRTINGQRSGALFNIAEIRAGRAPDPEVLGDDTIVVGLSNVKQAYRDILLAAPLLNLLFRPLY